MRSHHKKFRHGLPVAVRFVGLVAAVCSLLAGTAGLAGAVSVSGESTTIFRVRETTENKNIRPLYEYLNLSVTDFCKDGTLSFYAAGWGRFDLSSKSSDQYYNQDLQYGYLSYRAKQNNTLVNLGRQFVAEGVASEQFDGAYLRSDFAYGLGAAAFVGSPVVMEPNFSGGSVIYGGRISHSMPKYYSIGISAVKTDNGRELREEEGIDLWLHPLSQVDVVGRSSYNSLTSGWMEHAYTVSFAPADVVRFNAGISNINYRDYFHHVTTNIFSLTNGILNPNESVFTYSGSIDVNPIKNLTVSPDLKRYDYDLSGSATYFGGKVSYVQPENFSAGFSVHRMDGTTDKLRYDEYRVYAGKKLGKIDLVADYFLVHFDKDTNGVISAYELTLAGAYELTEQLKFAADVDFGRNSDFDSEIKGFFKLVYAFDTKHAAEGRAKSEK